MSRQPATSRCTHAGGAGSASPASGHRPGSSEKGRGVDRDPTVLQHQLKIAVADREHQIPAHSPQDHLGRELPALELLALRHATRSTACLVGTARLPNPDPPHKLATDPAYAPP